MTTETSAFSVAPRDKVSPAIKLHVTGDMDGDASGDAVTEKVTQNQIDEWHAQVSKSLAAAPQHPSTHEDTPPTEQPKALTEKENFVSFDQRFPSTCRAFP